MSIINRMKQFFSRFHRHKMWLGIVVVCLSPLPSPAQQTPAPSPSPALSQPAARNNDDGRVERFALALIGAGSDAERRALVAASPQLATGQLWDAFDRIAGRVSLYSDFEKAIDTYRVMRVVADAAGDRRGIARAMIYNGINIIDADEALENYRRAFQLAEAVGDKAIMGNALCAMASAFFRQEKQAAGFEYLQKGLTLIEESGDKALAARVLSDTGAIYYLRGDYLMAADYFQRSVALSEQVGDKYLMAIARFHLGAVHRVRGDYAQALEMYFKSQKLLDGFGQTNSLSSVLRHIATTYYLQRDYRLALSYQQRSLHIDEALHDSTGVAFSLLYGGMIYAAQGHHAQSLESLEKSLQLFESASHIDGAARALGALGSTRHALGAYDDALKDLHRSLALREKMEAKDGIAATLLNIGIVYQSKNDYAKSLEYAERAAAIARRIGSRQTLWSACTIIGKSRQALDQPSQARAAFDEAIAIIETLRAQVTGGEEERELFFEDKVYPYQQVIKTLLDARQNDEAFIYAERAKARVLLDVLSNARTDVTGRMSEIERERERNLKRDLTTLSMQLRSDQLRGGVDSSRLIDMQRRLDQARLDYTEFQANLYAAYPELRVRRNEVQAVTRTELSELLPDEQTALLEYVVTDDRVFLFVFTLEAVSTPDVAATDGTVVAAASGSTRVNLKVYPLATRRSELALRVEGFRRQLAQRNILFRVEARALYELLLEPARGQLTGVKRLVIVPDESLWELPFQALQHASGRYAIEDYAVSYAPSLTALREMAREQRSHSRGLSPQRTLLAFGNPTTHAAAPTREQSAHANVAYAPLPEAERLVRKLAELYGANRSRVYTGAEANEERFKAEAGRYRIVHLAAHGVLNDANPMYSHVVLTQGAAADDDGRGVKEDGLLEAWELMGLNLHADLVVLSACETARGGIRPGEGIIGLAWGLFVAGSPTAIVSQWKIDAASTTELMLPFHRQFSTQGRTSAHGQRPREAITKADALRTAALELLRSERYSHPFYWAGFVLIGDGS